MVLRIIAFLLCVCSIYSQGDNSEFIKASNNYYYGEAVAENEKEASDEALGQLTRQIAVKISSSFEKSVVEKSQSFDETVKNILNTYSTATLKNVLTIKKPANNRISIFHYIEKSEVRKIFEERIKLAQDIFRNAENLEGENNFGHALKSYYFAIILLNSIPEQNIAYRGYNLITEIPNRINKIISNVKFSIKRDEKISGNERNIIFDVTVFNKPAQFLDLSFWDGTGQISSQSIDGEAVIKLIGSSIDFNKLDISIKYSYYEAKDENKEVSDLWNLVLRPNFDNKKQIDLKNIKPLLKEAEAEVIKPKLDSLITNSNGEVSAKTVTNEFKSNGYECKINSDGNCPVVDKIGNTALQFMDILSKKNPNSIKTFLNSDQFLRDKILNIVKYNNSSVCDKKLELNLNKTSTGWELRKIKVTNKYSSIHKQTSEYIILDFDKSGEFYDVNFGITEDLYKRFVEQGIYGNDWGNRQEIIKFVEKYRTAFLSRNIEMLDSLFADEAVIIVGRILKKTKIKDVYNYLQINKDQPDYVQMKYTKNEYLKNQSSLFRNQKDIYLGYSTFKIMAKNNQSGIYGISMRQNYTATNYADDGHLFLLVDFLAESPKIYIRSWQPKEWNEDAIIGLGNFKINK